jgi:chaperonin GroEL
VGTIDANGEREIGELITKTMEKFDKEGVITIDVSKNTLKELTLMHSIIL